MTPLPIHLKLSALEGDLLEDPTPYRSIVGKLNFLTNTRPNLSYAIKTLSQFMQKPRSSHRLALQHILLFVNHTCGQGIFLKASNKITIQAFSDSDRGSCIDTRASIIDYIIMFGQSPKQGTVSRSSSEAEYRTMASPLLRLLGLLDYLDC